MNNRRFLVLAVACFLLFLGIYTWNQRTGFWDKAAANTGLELTGSVLGSIKGTKNAVVSFWDRYIALMDVREENDLLRQKILSLQADSFQVKEDRAELARLRAALQMPAPDEWQKVGARVLAWRFGPNSALSSVILNRGYLSGATPGTPVSTPLGLVGRVLKAGPTTCIVLLLSDPGSRVAVISSLNRTQGILTGNGPTQPLELRFVSQNQQLSQDELLLTSGLDGAYPKGIPVALVSQVAPVSFSSFQQVQATALIDPGHLEEVYLLAKPAHLILPDSSPVYQRNPSPTLNDPPRQDVAPEDNAEVQP